MNSLGFDFQIFLDERRLEIGKRQGHVWFCKKCGNIGISQHGNLPHGEDTLIFQPEGLCWNCLTLKEV